MFESCYHFGIMLGPCWVLVVHLGVLESFWLGLGRLWGSCLSLVVVSCRFQKPQKTDVILNSGAPHIPPGYLSLELWIRDRGSWVSGSLWLVSLLLVLYSSLLVLFHSLFVVCCLVFVARCSLFVVYVLLFVVYYMLQASAQRPESLAPNSWHPF